MSLRMNGEDPDLSTPASRGEVAALHRVVTTLSDALTDVHQDIGRLLRELADTRGELREFKARIPLEMRATADDSAQHRIDAMRIHDLEGELQERRDSSRVRADRKWSVITNALALLIASGLGALITHLVHQMGK